MKRTRTLLVAGILIAAAAAAVRPGSGTGADAPNEAATSTGLYVFRWLELTTGPDGVDLRSDHFGEALRGQVADSGESRRFGTLVLDDPEAAITRLRKTGDVKVLERARIVIAEPSGAGQFVSGLKIPVESVETRGDDHFVRTVFEQGGVEMSLQRIRPDSIRYEIELAAPTYRSEAGVPVVSNRSWESVAKLPDGHTLVLSTQVRHEPWLGRPLGAAEATKSRETHTRIWIVLITRTALR